MNIVLSELKVTEGQSVTKRIAGLIGEEIEAMETYALKAEPNAQGVYAPITITPVSFDYLGGIAVKGDGVSQYVFNDNSLLVGKALICNGPTPKNTEGTIVITPLYNVIDSAKVLAAVQDGVDPTKWTLTLEDKNYLYSSIYGTPVTGKLSVIGRSFVLSAGSRLAQIIIDQVLKEGDVLAEMTSDEYNARVAEEIQRKIDYFFGTGFATASYNTNAQRYQIIMDTVGAVNLNISATSTEDLSYFGFAAPTYNVGSDDLEFPRAVFMTGGLIDMEGYAADITGPDTMDVIIPELLEAAEEDFVGQSILVGNAGTINYEVIIYK